MVIIFITESMFAVRMSVFSMIQEHLWSAFLGIKRMIRRFRIRITKRVLQGYMITHMKSVGALNKDV